MVFWNYLKILFKEMCWFVLGFNLIGGSVVVYCSCVF